MRRKSVLRKALKFGIAFCFVVAAGITGFLAYMGAFASLTVEERTAGPYLFVYREMQGKDFSQVEGITNELKSILSSSGFKDVKPSDVYYPSEFNHPNEIAFLVSDTESLNVPNLDSSVKTKIIPRQECMILKFPFRNPLSFFVGSARVDSALKDHRHLHGYAVAPAYVLNEGNVITYIQPIVRDRH